MIPALVEVQLMVAGQLLPASRTSVVAEGLSQIVLAGPVPNATVIVTADSPVAVEVQVVSEGRLAVVPGVPMLDNPVLDDPVLGNPVPDPVETQSGDDE